MSCLEGMGLSPEQREAALDGRSQLLVSACAGSGKTRLLVAYFVRALLEEGVPPERLVAVTFTRKAAGELVSRIRSSLEACGRPDLARSLDAAVVGTIHSLCHRLIKENALEAGVDPAGSVLEAEAADLVRQRLGRMAWERVVETAGDAELEVLAGRGDDLWKQALRLYERLRGMGRERPQVEVTVGPPDVEAPARLAAALQEALAAGFAISKPSATLQGDLEKLGECLDWLEQPLSIDERVAGLAVTEGFFPRRGTSLEARFELVRQALTAYRMLLAEVRLRPLVITMNRLLAELHEHYQAYKRERRLVDFADLELRAHALVAGGRPGRSARLMPGARILVDEFQDTNELQCGILDGLGADRLVLVGDERQSIYRFRGADVSVFRDREALLDAAGHDGARGGLHKLDVNYRSRPELLAFLNRLFSHEAYFGERFVALRAGASSEEGRTPRGVRARGESGTGPPAVEILVAERRQEDRSDAPLALIQEAEAGALACRIEKAIRQEGRRQRDIVVLIPAQTRVTLYQQALLARGVDVYVVGGRGYYTLEEVADVVSLLRLLVNPHDDLALVTALRSPLAGLSDDGLYLLGRQGRKERASLWDVLQTGCAASLSEDDQRLLALFRERLTALRHRVGRPGLARLIDDAISAYDYDLCVLASPEARPRFANVRKLMRLAEEFEAAQGPDLAAFVEVLGSMRDLGDREGSAPTLAEGEDVVRIMTVHQAKGLEFPMVVLAGLGSDVYHPPLPEFMLGDKGRMGVFLKGSQRKTYESEDLCWGPAAELAAEERRKESEEDARLLYVAMTRAQDQLVLVGARPKGDNTAKNRIGRILACLGVEALPEHGATVHLAGLDAVLESVELSGAGTTETDGHGAHAAVLTGEGYGTCPEFLVPATAATELRQVSFSALAAYARCPRQFYLERILGLSLPPSSVEADGDPPAAAEVLRDDDEAGAGRDTGLLVHALLERVPLEERPPTEVCLRETALQWLRQTGVHLSPASLERALALTRAFWDSPLAGQRAHPAAVREAPFFFPLGDVVVSGVMDLVRRADDGWRIVDYKTNALGTRSPRDVAESYELQVVTYCLAGLRAGAPAVQMDLVFLEQPRAPVSSGYTREDVPRLQSRLEAALEGLRQGLFPARVGDACTACPVASACMKMAWS